MTKKTQDGFTKEFQGQITNLKNSYLLSFAMVDLLSHDDVMTILAQDSFKVADYEFSFSQISTLVQESKKNKNKDFSILVWEYTMFSARSFFIAAYEAFKRDEPRYEVVRNLDWFIFLANIRHSLAHGIDAIWDLQYYGTKEISYTRQNDKKKVVIDKNLNNTPMKLEHIGGWATVIDLLVFIENFVEQKVLPPQWFE